MTSRSMFQTHSIYITTENKEQGKLLGGLLEAVASIFLWNMSLSLAK